MAKEITYNDLLSYSLGHPRVIERASEIFPYVPTGETMHAFSIGYALAAMERGEEVINLPEGCSAEEASIRVALHKCMHVRKDAAKMLGISERTIYRKMVKYNIDFPL